MLGLVSRLQLGLLCQHLGINSIESLAHPRAWRLGTGGIKFEQGSAVKEVGVSMLRWKVVLGQNNERPHGRVQFFPLVGHLTAELKLVDLVSK